MHICILLLKQWKLCMNTRTNTGKAATRLAQITLNARDVYHCTQNTSMSDRTAHERFNFQTVPREAFFFKNDQPSFRPTANVNVNLTRYEITGLTYPVLCWESRDGWTHKRNWHTTAFCAETQISYRTGEKTASRCWAESSSRMHKGKENSAPVTLHTGPTRPAHTTCSWTPACLSRSGPNSTAAARFRKVTSLPQCSRDRG